MLTNLNDVYSSLNPEFFRDFDSGRFLVTKTDLITIPSLVNFISLREFAEENEYEFSHFNIYQKIEMGILFFKRDKYLLKKGDGWYFNLEKLVSINSFNTKLLNAVDGLDTRIYLNRDKSTNLVKIDNITNAVKLIFLETYFFNKYRIIEEATHTEAYLVNLTDIDINKNKFTIKKDIKSFIIEIFGNWLNTQRGTIPFASSYFCSIKDALQVKNEQVRFNYLESEIKAFFADLKLLYSDSIEIKEVNILSEAGTTGADTLTVIIVIEILEEVSQIVIRTQA